VARISTFTAVLRHPVDAWLARELDVTRDLHARGAPVVPPTDLLPAGPHIEDGFALSFWTYVGPTSEDPPAPEVVGRMLAELHQALRSYPGDLPILAPPFNDIPRGLDRLAAMPDVMPRDEVDMLRRVADRLLPAARAIEAPAQPLHGDAHVYNLIPTARGLLWNDFEDVCLGPLAWDLSTHADPEEKMLAAYGTPIDADVLSTLRTVRLLHGVVWVLALQPELDEWATHVRPMLDALRPHA
jgi:Ser/Thr protein kinase RdoA (MazF antagonist)